MEFKKKIYHIANLLYFLLLLFVTAINLNAQTIEWTKTYGSTGQDGGESMILTSDSSIVIAGFKSSSPSSYEDILLMKTDLSGNQLWSKTFSLGLNDIARSVQRTQDGGFIIAGMTEVNPQTFDPFLIKTDSERNIQWSHQYDYGFGEDDRAHTVWQCSDGGYIIGGQTWLLHGQFGNYDMYIIKTDMNGSVQWTKIYFWEEQGSDVALGIQQLSDGGYIIGGLTQSSQWASYIIRTDDSGDPVWSNIYPGAWQSECYDIQSTPDGGFIYTGTESNFTTDSDFLLVKLNGDGVLQWKNIYGTVDADQGEFLQQLQDGGYIIAGKSATQSTSYDMYAVRTNSSGVLLWTSRIGGTSDDRATSVVTSSDGSYLITGSTWSYGLGLGDVYLVKLLDSIVPVELISFNAVVNGREVILDWSTATELNNLGFEIQKNGGTGEWINVGFVQGAGTTQQIQNYSYTDEILISGNYSYRLKQIDLDGSFEYSDVVEVEVNSSPARFSLEQNYPNPFNPSTSISYSIPENALVTLKIYDVLGNEVEVLINEQKEPGNYQMEFNATELSSGIYYYTLTAGSFTSTKKMILMK